MNQIWLCNNTGMATICLYDMHDSDMAVYQGLEQSHTLCVHKDSISTDNLNEDAEVISVFVSSDVTKEMIEALPNLKLIACRSTGFNNIDMDAAKELGIAVVNVPTYGEHTVAEYTLGLMLALTRKIIQGAAQPQTDSSKSEHIRGVDLHGKTLGIIGLGKIGRNVAELAQAFGMHVVAHDPHASNIPEDIAMMDLRALADEAHIVSLHAPLTDETRHIVNASFLEQMQDSAYLINTARGELVDTSALVSALKSGEIAGAALDVLEDEKLMNIHEEELLLRRGAATQELLEHIVAGTVLMHLPNTIVTGHNAYNTVEALQRINQTTLTNIKQYLAGMIQNEVRV